GSLVSAIALASFLVGLGRLHRVVGWSSAREGSGFVGHSRLHAVDAMVLLMFLVLLAAVLFVQPSV
ncbi:MAG TPA: hypothetical protein VGS21_11035, partial [Acidimicrobiales bacterium]|nr:hypothetical protein [Acidimicrobiales bacterium]